MPTVRMVTAKQIKAEKLARFRIVCQGGSGEEFTELYRAFKDVFGCRTVLRNPFPPQFDAKAVHEFIAYLTESAVGVYAAKKTIDAAKELFVAFIKYKFMFFSWNRASHIVCECSMAQTMKSYATLPGNQRSRGKAKRQTTRTTGLLREIPDF